MLANCPACGSDVVQGVESCPCCGRKLVRSTAESCAIGCAIAVAVVALIVGVLFVIGALAGDKRVNQSITPWTPSTDTMTTMVTATTATTATLDTSGPEVPDEAFLKTKAGRIWRKHAGVWTMDEARTVASGRINIGMSGEMVRAAWGRPEHINESAYRSGTHEQWVYGSRSYVYLENGVVTSISTTHE